MTEDDDKDSVKHLISVVKQGETTVFDLAKDDKGSRLTVKRRKLLPEAPRHPTRAESPRRAHELHTPAALAAYLKKYGGKDTVVFADVPNQRATAVLDETKIEGRETVSLAPQTHPLWAPWEKLLGRRVPLEEFAAHAAAYRRTVLRPDGRELALMFAEVKASVSIEVVRGRGQKAVNSIKMTTEVAGVRGVSQQALPDEITLSVPMYVGTGARELVLDLTVEADKEGRATVLVGQGTVAEARVAAFEEALQEIGEACEEHGATLVLGRWAEGPWSYLEWNAANKT